MSTPEYKSAARYMFPRRRAWLLERLSAADGISYDELCRELCTEFPQAGKRHLATVCAVRSVRDLLFDELAVTESDESMWLSPSGWAVLEALMASADG